MKDVNGQQTDDISTAIADAVSASLATPLAEKQEEEKPVPPAPAGETEQPVVEATDLEEIPGDEPPAGDTEPEGEPKVEAKPDADAPVAIKPIADKLATEFTISTEDGEIEVPDVIIEYKANGKARKDRIDQVVKLAQFGTYNQEKLAEAERVAVAAQDETTQLRQVLDQREAQLERLLQDEEYLAAVREAYDRENSPERRAARAEEQVQDLRVQSQMAEIASQGQAFYRDEVVPALRMIQESLPTVEVGEMEERVAYAMALHAAQAPNGQKYLPASQFPKLRDYLVKDLVFWAQMQHAMRTEGGSGTASAPAAPKAVPAAPKATPSTEVARAQAEAQRAKQQLARATRPLGRTPEGKSAEGKPAPSKPITTVDDAVAAATAAVMSSIQ